MPRRELAPFHFKQFSVSHQNSTLAVNTDAVLLGAWTQVNKATNILEIGTGCGVIALMLAQKSKPETQILAIDIDEKSCMEAKSNFENSPWNSQLSCKHVDYKSLVINDYDLIVSNPPFFRDSLKNPKLFKEKARHQDDFDIVCFAQFCWDNLKESGHVTLVYPFMDHEYLIEKFNSIGFQLTELCVIYPKPSKEPNRILIKFSKTKSDFVESKLILRDNYNVYNPEYKALVQDYLKI